MRQLAIDPTVGLNPDKRLDAPLGVFGYAVDVRELANPANAWESLNQVETRQALAIASPPDPAVVFAPAGQGLELPYQVYPMQLDGDKSKSYWLPMYFAGWNGHSMVLPDQDAAEIYQTTHPNVVARPRRPDQRHRHRRQRTGQEPAQPDLRPGRVDHRPALRPASTSSASACAI